MNPHKFLFFFLDKASKEQRKRKRVKKATPKQMASIENSLTETG
jgi:hypothetical protein